jgi:hypothetical protein
VGGHITKCNNSSAEKTYLLFLGRALLFFKKKSLTEIPGGYQEKFNQVQNFYFLKTVILEGYPSDTCPLQFLHQLLLFRQGHSQNNQTWAFGLKGHLFWECPCLVALRYT